MEKQTYQVGEQVQIQRGDKWITTTITRVEFHSGMGKYYYFTKASKGIGYPIALIRPIS